MPIFPQINANLIETQLPYEYGNSYDTVVSDVEVGMRFTFPRRASGITGYPANPLFHGTLNFQQISDAEVAVLEAFFDTMSGRWGRFTLLDPGGNLVQYSEDYSQAYWDKSRGITVGTHVIDPFGGNLATVLLGTDPTNSLMLGAVGPALGGLAGYVLNFSGWVNSRTNGQQLFIGFVDSGTGYSGKIFDLPLFTWVRIDYGVVIWTNLAIRVALGGLNTWPSGQQIYTYGLQCVPMKGPGGYVKSPENYGLHENCRFDVDSFARKQTGPGENSLQLPIVEVNT